MGGSSFSADLPSSRNSRLSRCGGSCFALVAELVYAVASKATVRKDVRVRFPLKARTVIGSSLAHLNVCRIPLQ